MKAPSEKHLEDYLWAHPEHFNDPFSLPGWKPFARQVQLPSGVADMIGTMETYSGPKLVVIELKKGNITSQSLAQTLRYMRDCYSIIWRAIDYCAINSELDNKHKHRFLPHGDKAIWDLVFGLIIGHKLPDESLCVAGEAANVQMATYEYNGESYHTCWYEIKELGRPPFYNERDPYESYLGTDLGQVCINLLRPSFSAADSAEKYLNDLEGGIS